MGTELLPWCSQPATLKPTSGNKSCYRHQEAPIICASALIPLYERLQLTHLGCRVRLLPGSQSCSQVLIGIIGIKTPQEASPYIQRERESRVYNTHICLRLSSSPRKPEPAELRPPMRGTLHHLKQLAASPKASEGHALGPKFLRQG